jgi:hypothetical protein
MLEVVVVELILELEVQEEQVEEVQEMEHQEQPTQVVVVEEKVDHRFQQDQAEPAVQESLLLHNHHLQ